MSALIYIILSAAGAQARFCLTELFDTRRFPWGVVAANFAACALLAVCARSGFLGGYGAYAGTFAATLSTFSSLNFGLFSMLRGGRYFAAAAYFGLSVLTAAVAVWAC